MQISTQAIATYPVRLDAPSQVTLADLARLEANAQDVMAIAMKLTDSWGQAMFVMDGAYVAKLFAALGYTKEVADAVYERVRSLAYVNHKIQGQADRAEFTWHITDAACFTLRGAKDLSKAMASVTDANIEQTLLANKSVFDRLMDIMPDYSRNLMFSPGVASTVMATIGSSVSAEKIYDLAWRYGGQVTKDLDGRLGVSTQFVRALTLTISATITK
ncbi:MAG: hypothetical protein U0359_00705 [Byssovorax sp.]